MTMTTMTMMMMMMMFESRNPPTPSMHVFNLTMPNLRPSYHVYKKNYHWSHMIMMMLVMMTLTMMMRMRIMMMMMVTMMLMMMMMMMMMIFESGNPPTLSMHVSILTMPNFTPIWHIYKKIHCWPHVAH